MRSKRKLYDYLIIGIVVLALSVGACKKEDDVPKSSSGVGSTSNAPTEFFKDPANQKTPSFTVIANSGSEISTPQDLDFNPSNTKQLWIINRGTGTLMMEASGGSTVMITNPGAANQTYQRKQDGGAAHFTLASSAIAFNPTKPDNSLLNYLTSGTSNYFATSQNGSDPRDCGDMMGPTLWPSDLAVYGINQLPENSCHIDMLHQSPYSKGIASQAGSPGGIFWVFDGSNKNLCMYNFVTPHVPGGDIHHYARVHRYTDVVLTGEASGIPSHMVLDENSKWLYIVDGGTKRILRVDINTGTRKGNLTPTCETIDEYWEMTGATQEVFASSGLREPCGIEIKGTTLFVTDYSTGEIIAYNTTTKAELARINSGEPGIAGIKIGPDGKIYFVNALTNKVCRVDPN